MYFINGKIEELKQQFYSLKEIRGPTIHLGEAMWLETPAQAAVQRLTKLSNQTVKRK